MARAEAPADPGPDPAAETALPEPAAAAEQPELSVAKGKYKVLLLGGARSGKSALLSSLLHGSYAVGDYAPTLGLDHHKVRSHSPSHIHTSVASAPIQRIANGGCAVLVGGG